mmetsp:Transcript_5005/g.8537  ORF Transcript_5005/g.8537 Transcript_5005/m.8537 type:complete len:90 (+) Transcript_5005:284-553(+)
MDLKCKMERAAVKSRQSRAFSLAKAFQLLRANALRRALDDNFNSQALLLEFRDRMKGFKSTAAKVYLSRLRASFGRWRLHSLLHQLRQS